MFEKLSYGGTGNVAGFVMNAALERARAAGIDPSIGCPCCGMTLAQVLTDASVGCAACYETFASELTQTIVSFQGWGAHVGKAPIG